MPKRRAIRWGARLGFSRNISTRAPCSNVNIVQQYLFDRGRTRNMNRKITCATQVATPASGATTSMGGGAPAIEAKDEGDPPEPEGWFTYNVCAALRYSCEGPR